MEEMGAVFKRAPVGHGPSYDDLAAKFMDHVIWISHAVTRVGPDGLWDEEDGFFYDVLRLPDGSATRLKVRSVVGLLPLCASSVVEPWERERVPKIEKQWLERSRRNPELITNIYNGRGYADRGLMALVTPDRLRRMQGSLSGPVTRRDGPVWWRY